MEDYEQKSGPKNFQTLVYALEDKWDAHLVHLADDRFEVDGGYSNSYKSKKVGD